MAALQAGFAGDADDQLTGAAADSGIGLRYQHSQHVVVERCPGFGLFTCGDRYCSSRVGGHAITRCQRHSLGVAGAGSVGEDPIALGVDVGEHVRPYGQGDQACSQQPIPHGLCTRCTVKVTLGLC
ncbi:hypothetical protein D3C84_957890 [compost metagenome]